MKIWLLEIGETLPTSGAARLFRIGLLSRFLASRGHDVTWWTSTFEHQSRSHVAPFQEIQMIDGFRLYMLRGLGYQRSISLQRVRHQADFAKQFYETATKSGELPDVIIAEIPTIEVAEMAAKFARENGVPILIDIRDEWPDEFVDLAPAILRPFVRLLLTPMFKKMARICKKVTGILSISERQLNYGLKFAERTRRPSDGVFPLGYTANSYSAETLAAATHWWKTQRVNPSKFIVCFFGTITTFFDLDTVIEASRILEKEFPIQFVLCGNGRTFKRLVKKASGLESVIFPGWVDREKIQALMHMSAAGLAPYARNTRMSLPNKPFEYLSGGLPVLSAIQGEFTEIINKYKCGINYQSDSVSELCDAIRRLKASSQLRHEMSQGAKFVFDELFATDKIFEKLETHLVHVVGAYPVTKASLAQL